MWFSACRDPGNPEWREIHVSPTGSNDKIERIGCNGIADSFVFMDTGHGSGDFRFVPLGVLPSGGPMSLKRKRGA